MEAYCREHLDPSKPTIGIWFHQIYWTNGNLAYVDALIREVEGNCANALAVFSNRMKDLSLGNSGADEVVEAYFKRPDGTPRIDALVNTMGMSMT